MRYLLETHKTCKTINGNEIRLIYDAEAIREQTVLIIGVFHGDEPQGKFLIEKYIEQVNTSVNKRSPLLFIPCLNPDGMIKKTRGNSNGVDINRNFPTKNWEKREKDEFYGGQYAASEIETRFIIETVERYKPDIILTLHSPYRIVNFDGPSLKVSEKIADIIKYPLQKDIGYPTCGSFGTWAGVERQIPTITLEFDEKVEMSELVEPTDKIFDYLSSL